MKINISIKLKFHSLYFNYNYDFIILLKKK